MRKVRVLAAALALGAGAFVGVSASVQAGQHRVARPQSSSRGAARTPYPVTTYTQEFQSSTHGFCPSGSGNAPCDGAEGDYGTIDRVPSRFSNGGAGDYAPRTPALVGTWMALTSGTQAIDQGQGCPQPTTEYCSGPYALFGSGAAMGHENVFPKKGFTVTDDLYLSPSTAAPDGALVDDDVGLNNHAGAYGRDNVITACPEAGGFVINFGNSSPGSCTGSSVITTDGWYRFVFIFSDVGGSAYVTEKVISESTGKVVVSSGAQPVGGTAEPISNWGGPGYFWLPTEDISGVPLANVAVQRGQVPHGHKP